MDFSRDFIKFACDKQVLRFGQFTTKAGRPSPYFFNAGLFNDGASLDALDRHIAGELHAVSARLNTTTHRAAFTFAPDCQSV